MLVILQVPFSQPTMPYSLKILMDISGDSYGLPFCLCHNLYSWSYLLEISHEEKITHHYKFFIVTSPVPFVDKLITLSFAIIVATAFSLSLFTQGIDGHALNKLFNIVCKNVLCSKYSNIHHNEKYTSHKELEEIYI